MADEPAAAGGSVPAGRPVPASEVAVEPAGRRSRLVEIRCGFADMAHKEAEAAAARVVEATRLCDEQAAALALAVSAIDPAATHSAKEAAHLSFRTAVAAARDRGQVEAAASGWLTNINRINAEGRSAQARVKHEREAAEVLLSQLAGLSDTAESSATMAAAAMEACRAAREAQASDETARDTEEAQAPAIQAGTGGAEQPTAPSATSAQIETAVPEPPAAVDPAGSVPATVSPMSTAPQAEEERPSSDWLVIDIRTPQPQAVIKLIRRDGRTMSALVDRMAGTDAAVRSAWQLLLSNFVDSVVAAAIDEVFFEFPDGDQFWGQFTQEQSRDVARGLAALGFRYDRFEGFADGRVPIQRDLALAVGQAGLLPVRVRYWPRPDEMAQLYRGVRVSADAFIASRAPALTLGELVRLLGRRAEMLSDLWNEWPALRPLLFSTSL
jgi:hypothetical protein